MSEAWREGLERACGFVLSRGTPLEQLRARALLGETPASAVTRALSEAGALSGEDPEAAVRALGVLDDLDQLAGGEVEALARTLSGSLSEDGAWGDPSRSVEERIVLSGHLGGYLTKSLRVRPRVRAAVDGFLCRTWSPDRVKEGSWDPIAAYAHWFAVNDSELSDAVLQWCGRELERGFRTRGFDALATARVFVLCQAAALPGASLSARELCEALANEQTEEGGFALSARALTGAPVEAALDGLTAWIRLGPAAAAEDAGGRSG